MGASPGLIAIVDRGMIGSDQSFFLRLQRLAARLDAEPSLWVRARCRAPGPPAGLLLHPRLIVPERWASQIAGPVALHRRADELDAGGPGLDATRADPRASVGTPSIFASVHDASEAVRAVGAGAHALLLAPVFAPRSKAGQGRGLALITEVAASVAVPVIALGGIEPARVAACLGAGAAGIAVLSPVSRPDTDPDRAIDALLAALDH